MSLLDPHVGYPCGGKRGRPGALLDQDHVVLAIVLQHRKHRLFRAVDVGCRDDGGEVGDRLRLAPLEIERAFIDGKAGGGEADRQQNRAHDRDVAGPVAEQPSGQRSPALSTAHSDAPNPYRR